MTTTEIVLTQILLVLLGVVAMLIGRRPPARLAVVTLTIGPVRLQSEPRRSTPMAATLELRDDQKCPLTIKITDAKGQPAPTDDAPLWQSSNPAVAEVMPSDDGLSCEIIAGVPGDATVSVSADADLGDGTTTIAGSIDVHVTPGSAMAVEITPGTPEAQ